jgi:hypothetical protein
MPKIPDQFMSKKQKPALNTYDWLTAKFLPIFTALRKKSLKAYERGELEADIDGILFELSKKLDAAYLANQRSFVDAITVTRDQCAAAVCPLCYDNTPRKELNGREVHLIKENVPVRCAANPIWSMGAKMRPIAPTPIGIFIDSVSKKVGPENGQSETV